MGCFSFMCKECGRPILSDSFSGQEVKLFLLDKGEIIEQIEGQYDSYGNVLTSQWDMDWHGVCDLMFTASDADGIAAIHSRCFTGRCPTTKSEDDPNQGWDQPTCKEEEYGSFLEGITTETNVE